MDSNQQQDGTPASLVAQEGQNGVQDFAAVGLAAADGANSSHDKIVDIAAQKDGQQNFQETPAKGETHVTLGPVPQQQMELNIGGTSSPNQGTTSGSLNTKQATALPISTKINTVGLKKASKPATIAQSPRNKGTGLDDPSNDQKPGRALNEDSMTRLLSQGNNKKMIGITQPNKDNAMGSYMNQNYGPASPSKSGKSPGGNGGAHPPVTAGEPQRSLIKGRGQYYKNYGAQQPGMTLYSNGQTAGFTTQGATAQGGTTGSIPGTANVNASQDPASSNYYSNNFGVTGGLSMPGTRPNLQVNTPSQQNNFLRGVTTGGNDNVEIQSIPGDMSEPGFRQSFQHQEQANRTGSMATTNPSAIQQYQQQLSAQNTQPGSQRGGPKPIQRTNVLTGAASTSYQLPVVWASQYMGLVGYQVQKENEENDKRLKQLQELAKQATLKKAEKKKAHLSLPMRGRHVYIGDKTRDQYMRCEFFKQANETEEVKVGQNNMRFLDHVKAFEEKILQSHAEGAVSTDTGGISSDLVNAYKKKSIREFKPLRTKAFDFKKNDNRQMSANDVRPSGSGDPLTKSVIGLSDLINRQSSITVSNPAVGANPYSSQPQTRGGADLPHDGSLNGKQGMATLDSLGSINIVNNNGIMSAQHLSKSAMNETKVAKVVDLNRNAQFPQNQQRKKNKNDFYRFLLQQNFGDSEETTDTMAGKVNNDILIPRSILKRNEAGLTKKGNKDNLGEFDELLNEAEQLASKEAVVGKQIDMNGPIVSPRTYNQNYLRNVYRALEVQEKAALIKQSEQNTLQQSAKAQSQSQKEIPQIPAVAQQQPSVGDVDTGSKSKSKSPRLKPKEIGFMPQPFDININQDLEIIQPQPQFKKKIVRRTQEDGFFKTGVEVIEHEEYEFDGTAQEAADALRTGQLTAPQIRELLQKKLKDDRIFGFDSYDEFNSKYFKKELVAFEEFHKVRQLKYARVKYNNRIGKPNPMMYATAQGKPPKHDYKFLAQTGAAMFQPSESYNLQNGTIKKIMNGQQHQQPEILQEQKPNVIVIN